VVAAGLILPEQQVAGSRRLGQATKGDGLSYLTYAHVSFMPV
jgi:hypothetical protein